MVLGKLDSHMHKNETGPLSYTIHTINPKWIKELNIRTETIKLLEENISSDILNMGFGDDFLDLTTNTKATKLHQTEKFLYSKENHQQIKMQPMEWGKITSNHISDKALISKIY